MEKWKFYLTALLQIMQLYSQRTFAKIVDHKNDAAYSNGNILFNVTKSIDDKIEEVLRFIDEIQILSRTVI